MRFFNTKNEVVNKILLALSVIWSVACKFIHKLAIRVFLGVNIAEDKRLIAIYPAALYYFYIAVFLGFSWFIYIYILSQYIHEQ